MSLLSRLMLVNFVDLFEYMYMCSCTMAKTHIMDMPISYLAGIECSHALLRVQCVHVIAVLTLNR